MNKSLTILLLCVGLLFFIFFRLDHTLWHPGIIFAYFMNKGLIFYRDFTNMHFPLSTFLLLPFYLVSNWNLKIEPLVSLIVALLTLLVIFRLSSILLSQKGTIITLFFFSLLFYYFSTSIQYSMEAVLGLLLITIIYRIILNINSKELSLLGIFFDGLLIGITELTGQIATMPLAIAFLSLAYLIFRKVHSKKGIIKLFSLFILGILVPIITLSLYFIRNNAFGDFFYLNIPYYLIYFQLAKEATKLSNLPWNQIITFYAPVGIALLIILLKYNSLVKNNIFIIITLLAASSMPSVIFSIFHPHHFLYILPTVAILTGLVFDLLLEKKILIGKYLAIFLLLLFTYQLAQQIFPWYWERFWRAKNQTIVNDVIPGSDMDKAISWIKLNTKMDDRILVAGDNLFYFKADRLPSAKRQLVAPWHYKPLEKTIPIIVNNRPDYWIIDSDYMQRLKSPEGWNSPEITEFLDRELKSCYQYLAAFSTWQIWKMTCHR